MINCSTKDEEKKADARKGFTQLIDCLLHTTYGPYLVVEHACNDVSVPSVSNPTPADSIFVDREPQVFRDARHKTLSHNIRGRVMQCVKCGSEVSTTEIVNLALESWLQTTPKKGSSITEQISQSYTSRYFIASCKKHFYKLLSISLRTIGIIG